MKRFGLILLVMGLLVSVPGLTQNHAGHVVLVTSAEPSLPVFSRKELRMLFLGIPVLKQNSRVTPLINASDPITYQGFLQKVVSMSDRNYQRQLVSRVFRRGGKRPARYSDRAALLTALHKDSSAVTFLTTDVVAQHDGIQIIQILW